jgi:hypothetical protein
MKHQTTVTVESISNDKGIVCDAVNCCAEASKEIEVSAGPDGETISLSVCDNCVKKFRQEVNRTGTAILTRQQTTELNY